MKSLCVLRVDAMVRSGMGHVSRGLAVAEALRGEGISPLLIIEPGNRPAEERLRQKRIPVEHVRSVNDLRFIRHCQNSGAVYFVDHYTLSSRVHSQLAAFRGAQLIDLPETAHPHDMLVFPTIYGFRLRQARRKMLVGPRFYPLSEEFRGREHLKNNRDSSRHTVFISLGGATSEKLYRVLFSAFRGIPPSADLQVALGGTVLSPTTRRLLIDLRKQGWRIFCHRPLIRPASMMARCDRAVAAGGITAYELASRGVPTGYVVVADNQLRNSRMMSRLRWGPYLGDLREVDKRLLGHRLDRFLRHRWQDRPDPDTRPDGHGARRIARELSRLANPRV